MKRRREAMEKGWSEIRSAVEELSAMEQSHEHEKSTVSSTLVFLRFSNSLIHILDKIGPTMTVLRLDIQRNTEKLEEVYVSDPLLYSNLEEILEKEVREGTTRKPASCSRSVVWLTRSIGFTLSLLGIIEKDSVTSLEQVVEEAYKSTLKPWHGWISSAAYKVAKKLIPERKIFISLLACEGQDYEGLKNDIRRLLSLLQPVLDETYVILRKFRLERLKSI